MTSAEKILAGILADSNAAAEQKKADARKEAQSIIDDAKAQIALLATETDKDIARQTALIEKIGASGASLILRDATLSVKSELIEDTLTAAKETIIALSDREYFELLCAIAENSRVTSGELFLNKRDIGRDMTVLKNFLSGTQVVLSQESVDIDGGFLLKNGDIEINASIDALIHEKRAELVDNINHILFNREGEA